MFNQGSSDVRAPREGVPYGSGRFGKWITDNARDPAYEYEMDQTRDRRAQYYVSGGHSTDHWHLLGNDRIAATSHNGGYVQVYDWSRGGKVLNRWDPARGYYAGGFKFVAFDGESFATLWDRLPNGAPQRRVFGIGYFEKRTLYRGVEIGERVEAPQGDDPVLLSTTRIENKTTATLDLSVTEFWDVNLFQLTPAPIMTHGFGRFFDWRRRRHNRHFRMRSAWNPESGVLSVALRHNRGARAPKRHEASHIDWYPKTLFLGASDGLPDDFRAYTTDGSAFVDHAGGVCDGAEGRLFSNASAYRDHAVLAIRRDVHVESGASVTLRYILGYSEESQISGLIEKHRNPAISKKRPCVEFTVPGQPWLRRELAWHSYYLQANTFYDDFAGAHFIDQGSAYSYMQGLSGAPRDFFLFTLPMIYLRPELAREMLCFSMRSQKPESGEFPYAHVGHGKLTGFVVHSKSSDLDLFFFWALGEYLAATQDRGFLDKAVPFYPASSGKCASVLEHAKAAFRHLTERVGLGPHGLLRCGTGDWNDLLMTFSRFYAITVWRGESALNAGLAAMALPRFADFIDETDPDFAASLRAFAEGQRVALRSLWTGKWVARGYLGYLGKLLGQDRIFLDTQAFPVLGDVWEPSQVEALFETIQSDCVAPQRVGALSMWPPMKGALLDSGSDTNGGTWAAIDSWIAWAWSKFDSQRAWEFFLNTTLAAHAEAYPDIWYGIWSGPDSYNAHYHSRPGETFNITLTPMTDFPVMNSNRHSGPLLDAIKLAGIEPRGGIIAIDPKLPFDAFAIRLPLIEVAYQRDCCRGRYTPFVEGEFRFSVRSPSGFDPKSATLKVDDKEAAFSLDANKRICFAVAATHQPFTWEILQRASA